jgi:LacI family transcriptional regulator
VVTMREVADAAGVSIATVSRVLSGTRRVDPELVDRVRATQEQLGYRTNLLASGLRLQRTDTVGMVVPQVANPYFSSLMQEVGRRLQAIGKTVLLVDAENDPRVEADGVHRLLDRSVDGLIAIPVDEHESVTAMTEAAGLVRLVQLDRAVVDVPADLVAVDHAAGIGEAVEHLAGLGCRRLALISAARRDSTARERADAFDASCSSLGLEVEEPLLGEYSVEWGRDAAARLLDAGLPDGVVCGNDLIALGVLSVLREAGVDVPGRVKLTGYDDVGFATLTSPEITSVRQPLDRLAEAAVSRLLHPSEDGQTPSVERFVPSLMVRRSTVDPASAGSAQAGEATEEDL